MASSKILGPVIKSPSDDREYLAFELGNKLTVLAVSDSSSQLAAAALANLVGYYSDPNELPGLAHYLEHMLFMGTEKYPVENEYSAYLSQNGGSCNAYTDTDVTCFHFECMPDKFEGALDRFSRYFVCPLFTEDCAEREVNAVDSEFEARKLDDGERAYRIGALISDPVHPFSKFGIGNKESLWDVPRENGINVREQLMKFHSEKYSSNIMKLCVVGPQSCDELRRMVEEYFSDVPNIDLTPPDWPSSPIRVENTQTRIDVVPVQDTRTLELEFSVPYFKEYLGTGAARYVAQLLNETGPGSLIQYLKDKNYISDLTSYVHYPGRGFGLLGSSFELTPSGLDKVDEIILHYFEYVKVLIDAGPQRWYWDQMRCMSNSRFRFLEKDIAYNLCTDMVESMASYPVEQVWKAKYNMTEFSEEWISAILSKLDPSKARVFTMWKPNENIADQTEHYYGAKYRVTKIPKDTIQSWIDCGKNSCFKFPSENIFIPTEFDLKPKDSSSKMNEPKIIVDTELARAWFMQDTEYLLPLGYVRLDLYTPLMFGDPKNSSLASLLLDVIGDALEFERNKAQEAGLQCSLGVSPRMFRVLVSGYDHKISLFFLHVIKAITCLEISQERFDTLKEVHIRSLKNFKEEEPRSHASEYDSLFLTDCYVGNEEMLLTEDELTLPNLINLLKAIVQNVKLELKVFGNFTEKEALELYSQTETIFKESVPLFGSQLKRLRTVQIPEGSYVYHAEHLTHAESCIRTIFQCCEPCYPNRVTLALIQQIISEPCFDILRTKKQLGYHVSSYVSINHGAIHLQFLLQGEKHPLVLDREVEMFLQEMEVKINALTEEEYITYRDAAINELKEKPKTLYSRCSRLEAQITSNRFNFHEAEVLIEHLKTVDIGQIRTFFQKWISPSSASRRKFSIHILSKAKGGAGDPEVNSSEPTVDPTLPSAEIATDFVSWRKSCRLLSHMEPFIDVPPMKTRSRPFPQQL